MTRKLGSAGLAISVLLAVISLLVKGGVGVSQAILPPSPDFNLTSAKAEITHETANSCLTPGSFISCLTSPLYSDSFEILANLAVLNTEFFTDLNQTMYVALFPGNCSTLTNATVGGIGRSGGFVIPIPGADLKMHSNKNGTMYTFEGNVQGFPTGVATWAGAPFVRVEVNFKFPTSGSPTLALEGNANLCGINGPMALTVSFGDTFDADFDRDIDGSCVNISPEFETLDISQVFCID